MSAQMKTFIDQAGQLWMSGALVGKVGSVFTSSATQHGGQESTILTFHPVLLHLGFVIVGLPYAFQGQMGTSEVMGNSPYGASTIAGGDGSRQPSKVELDGARWQGRQSVRPLPGSWAAPPLARGTMWSASSAPPEAPQSTQR